MHVTDANMHVTVHMSEFCMKVQNSNMMLQNFNMAFQNFNMAFQRTSMHVTDANMGKSQFISALKNRSTMRPPTPPIPFPPHTANPTHPVTALIPPPPA